MTEPTTTPPTSPTNAATSLRVERRVAAPPDRVWRALTESDELARWLCPNPDLVLTVAADVTPGGAYTVDMGGSYVATGVYTAVETQRVLEFTWQWQHEPDSLPSTVRIELAPDGADGTALVLTHRDLADADEAAGHDEGWQLILGRLGTLLAV